MALKPAPAPTVGDSFQEEDRASGLGDLLNAGGKKPPSGLKAPEKPVVQPPPAIPQPVPVQEERGRPETPVRREDTVTTERIAEEVPAPLPRKVAAQTAKAKQSTAYVSASVNKRLQAYKKKKDCSVRDVVFRALAQTMDRHKEIIDASRYYVGEVNELFPPDPSKMRFAGHGPEQAIFKPTTAQEQILLDIERELGFTSRSTWIAPLLNEFLPGKKDMPGAQWKPREADRSANE